MKTVTKNKKQKKIIVVIIAAILLLGGGFVYALNYLGLHPASHETAIQPTTSAQKSTTASSTGASSTSQAAGPSDSTQSNESSATSGQPSTNVGIVIVAAAQDSDNVEVRSYANALEDGTCTYKFTKGSTVVTEESAATAGASTTSCATLNVPASEFDSSGSWSLVVTYVSSSGQYSGSSSPQTVTID